MVTVYNKYKNRLWGEVQDAFLAGGVELSATPTIFHITTNLWSNSFLAENEGGDSDHVDSDQNNNNK